MRVGERAISIVVGMAAMTLAPLGSVGAQVVVTGVVIDSLTGRPLAGATVQVQRDSTFRVVSATTDSAGKYRLEGLAAGSYIGGFFHEKLDSLGIGLTPRRLVFEDGPRRVDFGVPSAKTITASLCPRGAQSDSLGLLVGYARNAESSLGVASTVTVLWFELTIGADGIHRNRQQIPVKTNNEGWFALCGLPTDTDVLVSAVSGDAESGAIAVRVPPGGLLVRDFRVSRADSVVVYADSAATDPARRRVTTLRRGSARVSGVVHTVKGKPVSNAEVSVPGTGVSMRTPDAGVFSLTGLPAGTQTVEVRAIGFEPKRIAVDLTRDGLTTLDVLLDKPVQMLDVVKVFGQGRSSIAAFERRRRAGWGRFLTPADIAKRNAIRVTDLFFAMPGVRVLPNRGFGNIVLVRGCAPTVYLNGMRMGDDAAQDLDMLANPTELTAVEVYSASGRPAEFWGNPCGSIVLWAGMMPR